MYNKKVSKNGTPYERGSADAHSNRPMQPHYYRGAFRSNREKITEDQMTDEEITDYIRGHEKEKNRKIW